MDIRGKQICGRPAVEVRDAQRAFNDLETSFVLDGGQPRLNPNSFIVNFIVQELHLTEQDASNLLKCLISSGYIDPDKLTPTTLGMALIGVEDRDRISLNEAPSSNFRSWPRLSKNVALCWLD